MHRKRRKRNIVIFSLVGVFFLMVAGYAAFSTNLEIKGTSKVTSNWDIEITNVTEGIASGSAENTVKPSWDKLWASMEADLYDVGDSMEYDVTIENKGNIDAKLNDILTNVEKENNEAVIITFTGYTKGEILKAGASKQVHVKIEYNPEYEGGETSSEVEINFDYVQNNNEKNPIESQYLITYDYQTNGGTNADIKEEYYASGSNINLENTAYKEGWTFVGWNTDKDANIGLENYQIKENTTLYAIYSKTLKITYEKGENIESIGKVEDSCTIYNNEISCEVILPTITPKEGYIVNGWYSENNKIGDAENSYKISNDITLISQAIIDNITLSLSSSSTTNSINVSASANATTGIVKYEYRIDNGNWETGNSNTYTFNGLKQNKDYTIEVRVTSKSGKQLTKTITVLTQSIPIPTFNESGTEEEKEITITYPSGCGSIYTCTYIKDGENPVTVNDTIEIASFTKSGTLIATVSDGTNEVSNAYNIEIIATLQSWGLYSETDFHSETYKESIISAEIVDTKEVPNSAIESWDVSEKQNGEIMAWVIPDENDSSKYHLYIGGNGGVKANADSKYIFYNFNSLETLDLTKLDTSKSTLMSNMFDQCNKLTIIDVSSFDTSKVTEMSAMFRACSDLTTLNVSNFDTSNISNMGYLFDTCSSLTALDISSFDTSNVTNMYMMFYRCNNLEMLDVSGFDTKKVINMGCMFSGCKSLKTLDVSNFDTNKVTNMSSMFFGCTSLTTLDVSGFDTSNVTNMSNMFDQCSELTILDVNGFDTSNVTNMHSMFSGCKGLTILNVNKFNTANVNDMSNMFFGCTSLTTLDVSGFDTSNVTNMSYMFSNCEGLSILNVNKFNTANVNDMSSMFYGCTSLTTLDVSGFDTSNVTNMSSMFDYCPEIITLDISNFDTSKVTNMDSMFSRSSNLEVIYVGPNWTAENASTFNMFYLCGVSEVTLKQ